MKSPFTVKVIEIIGAIPPGMVCTYGIVAAHANNRRAARQVARILHSSSARYDLPWHRVVNREGSISLPRGSGYEEQKKRLLAEGVEFGKDGRIDFTKFLWWPP